MPKRYLEIEEEGKQKWQKILFINKEATFCFTEDKKISFIVYL